MFAPSQLLQQLHQFVSLIVESKTYIPNSLNKYTNYLFTNLFLFFSISILFLQKIFSILYDYFRKVACKFIVLVFIHIVLLSLFYKTNVSQYPKSQQVGERVIEEIERLNPKPPSINVFDAGLGDAAVLTRVLRGIHGKYPTVPILAVAKEISLEDVRQSLTKMPDRFSEHPQTVLAVTNMTYKAAPGLQAMTERGRRDTNWIEMPLTGNTAIDFERQIEENSKV